MDEMNSQNYRHRKASKRAQRRLTESYTKIIEAFEKCTIKANDMANA